MIRVKGPLAADRNEITGVPVSHFESPALHRYIQWEAKHRTIFESFVSNLHQYNDILRVLLAEMSEISNARKVREQREVDKDAKLERVPNALSMQTSTEFAQIIRPIEQMKPKDLNNQHMLSTEFQSSFRQAAIAFKTSIEDLFGSDVHCDIPLSMDYAQFKSYMPTNSAGIYPYSLGEPISLLLKPVFQTAGKKRAEIPMYNYLIHSWRLGTCPSPNPDSQIELLPSTATDGSYAGHMHTKLVLRNAAISYCHAIHRIPKCPPKEDLERIKLEHVVSDAHKNIRISSSTGVALYQLAGSMAKAVLDFHSTGWLYEKWNEGVCFSTANNNSEQQSALNSPPWLSSRDHHLMPSELHGSECEIKGLGEALLDIGCPNSLYPDVLVLLKDSSVKERAIQQREWRLLKTREVMFETYGKIVKRCLDNNVFDTDDQGSWPKPTDFGHPEADSIFTCNVIKPLDAILCSYRQLTGVY